MAENWQPPIDYEDLVKSDAKSKGLDPHLAWGVAKKESNFKPDAYNKRSRATGLMQLMPGTAEDLGVDPKDPVQNVDGGNRLLKSLLNKHGQNVDKALKEYGGFVTEDPTEYINAVKKNRQESIAKANANLPKKPWEPPIADFEPPIHKGMSIPEAIVQEGKNILQSAWDAFTAPGRALQSGSEGDYMEGGGGPGEEEAANTAMWFGIRPGIGKKPIVTPKPKEEPIKPPPEPPAATATPQGDMFQTPETPYNQPANKQMQAEMDRLNAQAATTGFGKRAGDVSESGAQQGPQPGVMPGQGRLFPEEQPQTWEPPTHVEQAEPGVIGQIQGQLPVTGERPGIVVGEPGAPTGTDMMGRQEPTVQGVPPQVLPSQGTMGRQEPQPYGLTPEVPGPEFTMRGSTPPVAGVREFPQIPGVGEDIGSRERAWRSEQAQPINPAFDRLTGPEENIPYQEVDGTIHDPAQELKNTVIPKEGELTNPTTLPEEPINFKGSWNKQRGAALIPGGKLAEEVRDKIGGRIGDIFQATKATVKGSPDRPKPTGPVAGIYQFDIDRRSGKEVFTDAMNKGGTDLLKQGRSIDIPQGTVFSLRKGSKLYAGIQNFTSSKMASVLAEKFPVSGEMIKWASDQVRMISRDTRMRTEGWLKGNQFGKSPSTLLRPWDARLKGGGAFETWDSKKTSRRDLIEANKTILKAGIDGREPVKEDFANPTQHKIYQEWAKARGEMWEKLNEQLRKSNIPPIAFKPGYFPMFTRGDWKIIVKDPQGMARYIAGANTKFGARMDIARLKRLLPEELKNAGIEPHNIGEDIRKANQDRMHISDLSAFEESLKMMSQDDPARAGLHKAYLELTQRRGFGVHGLQRKGGWTGFEGSEGGYKGAKKMRQAMEDYLRQGSEYIGNLQKNNVKKQWFEAGGIEGFRKENGISLPNYKVDKLLPQATKWMIDMVDHARGADLMSWDPADIALLKLSEMSGFGYNMPTRMVRRLGNFGTMIYLANPHTWIYQFQQHLNYVPRMLKNKYVLNQFGSVSNAYFHGIKQFIWPDDLGTKAMNWAVRRGYMTTETIDLMNTPLTNRGKSWTEMPSAGGRYVLGKIEQEIVRTPTFLMAEYGFRNVVKDDVARFERAAEETNHYMTDYSKEERAMVLNRLGFVGKGLQNLKTFSLSYFGQLFEYLGDMRRTDPKSWIPMTAYCGNMLTATGIHGFVGVAEVTALYHLWNWLTNRSDPDPQQAMEKSGWPTWLTWGAISQVSGLFMNHSYDFHSSLAFPTVGQLTSSVPWEYGKAVVQGAKTAYDTLQGEATRGSQMRSLEQVAPAGLKGWVEQAYSPDYDPNKGGRVEAPTGGNWIGAGAKLHETYVRDTEEWAMRKWMGSRSVDEARFTNEVNLMDQGKQQAANVERIMMTVMADHALHDPNWFKKEEFRGVLNKFTGPGRGDPEEIYNGIVNQMKEEMMNKVQLELIKNGGLSWAEQVQKMKEFDILIKKMEPEELGQFNSELEKRGSRK